MMHNQESLEQALALFRALFQQLKEALLCNPAKTTEKIVTFAAFQRYMHMYRYLTAYFIVLTDPTLSEKSENVFEKAVDNIIARGYIKSTEALGLHAMLELFFKCGFYWETSSLPCDRMVKQMRDAIPLLEEIIKRETQRIEFGQSEQIEKKLNQTTL